MASLNGWKSSNVDGIRPGTFVGNSASTSSFRIAEPYAFRSSNELQKRVVGKSKQTWTCRQCGKALSSKRSFDEHSNIHSQTKPFACEHCDFAAASQMTLRRHNLRFHTPRQSWGYKCPYCSELYMEPASYQQHVASRHFGKSATFGCPSAGCSFTTRCSGHFISHVSKHSRMNISFSRIANTPLERFVVDDKLGVGYGKRPLKKIVRPGFIRKVLANETTYEDYMKTPISFSSDAAKLSSLALSTKKEMERLRNVERVDTVEMGLADKEDARQRGSDDLALGRDDFIVEDVGCLEIVVDDSQPAPNVLHEGMVEPELD